MLLTKNRLFSVTTRAPDRRTPKCRLTRGILHSPFHLRNRYGNKATMADDIAEEIRPYVHKILRIVLNVKGKTLRELNELVGQTSEFETQSIVEYLLRLHKFRTIISIQFRENLLLSLFLLNSNTSADQVDFPQQSESTQRWRAQTTETADLQKSRSQLISCN